MDIADVDNLNFNLNVLEEQDDGNAPDVSHLMEGFDGEELSLFCDAITSEEVFDNIPLIKTENTNLSDPLEDTLIEQESLISSDYSIHNSSISHTPTPSKIGSSSYTKNSSKGLHLLYLTSSGQQPTQIPDNPEDQAELIASNATIALRQSGLAFMEQESGTINTIDEFRSAFYGSNGGEDGVDMMGSDDEGGYGNDSDNETGKNKKRKKGKRPHNPDSDLIEAATEEQLLVLNIDPIGKEGKKQRRRIRNRMSAQLHRERKKLYIDALEAFVKLKDAKIRQLESDVAKLAQENRMLKQCQAPLLPTALSGGLDVEEQEVTREAQGSSSTGSTTSVTGSMTDGTDGHSEASMSPVHVGLPDVDIEYGDTQSNEENEDSTISSNTNTRTRKRARASSGKGASGSTGILVAKGFGSVLPFLSVICVLCLTYYQTGVDLGLGGMMSFPSSSSPLSNVDSTYETMSMMDFNDNDQTSRHRVLLELPLPPTTGTDGNDGEKALISSSLHQSDRPLHSYSLSSISNTFDKHHVYSYPNTNQDSTSNRRALWSYPSEHLMMTLYPRYKEVSVNRTSKSVYSDINTTWTEPVVKRHLRVRSQGNLKKSTVPPSKAIVPQPQSSVSTKSLVPATVSAIHTTHGHEVVSVRSSAKVTDEGVPQVAVSRVLMEDGQALLDPKMTEVITVQAKGGTRENHKSSTGSYSPHYAIDMGPGSSSYASSRSSSDNMISSDNNVLFMLVPASSVRWGNTWKDSYSSTESLLQHLQDQKQENETVADGSNGDGELYIELGCSIFKAQLVRDVEALQNKMS